MSRGEHPAFPVLDSMLSSCPEAPARGGLTKRELIAAMALQGMLAYPMTEGEKVAARKEFGDIARAQVAAAVAYADRLLVELGKDGKS